MTKDNANNMNYGSITGCNSDTNQRPYFLRANKNETPGNNYGCRWYDCDGKTSHKTQKSKYCNYYSMSIGEIIVAKEEFIVKGNETVGM